MSYGSEVAAGLGGRCFAEGTVVLATLWRRTP